MPDRLTGARVLIYSHDTFGLGHLRRCRTIAHALVDHYKGLSVLILSGSPIIGSFDYRARVDFVRIPGVIKLRNGEYTSLGLHIDLEQTLAMRASIIRHTAEIFAPDLFLVDKEPLGLKGEVLDTLQMLKLQGTRCVLGVRDVMDDPLILRQEWQRKRATTLLDPLYDEIWVYGPRIMGNPLDGIGLPPSIDEKMIYTGYLPRSVPQSPALQRHVGFDEPFILVTGGGGGDAAALVDWVLRAYEAAEHELPYPAVVVLGPFMAPGTRKGFTARARKLSRIEMLTFDDHIEMLIERAEGLVAMGGYNTFCEILSLDKRAILVPRTQPRREQLIRAGRAADLGLIRMLDPEVELSTETMVQALKALPTQDLPSSAASGNWLTGLEIISERVQHALETTALPADSVTERNIAPLPY